MMKQNGPLRTERRTVSVMIHLFCRKHHGTSALCESCTELLAYADSKLERCRFGDAKPTCRNCPVHCYSTTMRKRIAEVMRFAGPRLIFSHPILALRHLLNKKKPTA